MGPGSPLRWRRPERRWLGPNDAPTCGCTKRSLVRLACFRPVIYRERCNFSVSRRERRRASDHFLGLVVGLAVTPQGRRLGAGIKLFQPGRDLGVLALEQAVAGKVPRTPRSRPGWKSLMPAPSRRPCGVT